MLDRVRRATANNQRELLDWLKKVNRIVSVLLVLGFNPRDFSLPILHR